MAKAFASKAAVDNANLGVQGEPCADFRIFKLIVGQYMGEPDLIPRCQWKSCIGTLRSTNCVRMVATT